MNLGIEIAGGVVLLVSVVLTVVFVGVGRAMRRHMAEQRAALESEGIELDGGIVSGTIRYRDYRAPGFHAGTGVQATRRHLVLTRSHLAILGGKVRFHIPRPDLGRYAVRVVDHRLQIVSDDPHGATGHVDLRLAVRDAERWAATLRDAGCRLAS